MILVTGGSGFVGRRLVSQLASSGHRVRVVSRRPGAVSFAPEVEVVGGDLEDAASLARAAAGAETVVHLAARVPGSTVPESMLERVNAAGTSALAGAARDARVRRFVHVGSAGVYGDGATLAPHRETDPPHPGNGYERSKLAAEAALRGELDGSEVRWTILRPAGVYGPGRPATASLFRQVARRRLWLHGPSVVIVHPTYVDDVVAAIRLVLGRDDVAGQIFNVGGERALDYMELVALIGARLGRSPMQLRAPAWSGRAAAAAAGLWRMLGAGAPARLERLGRPIVNRGLDISKARQVLAFEPVPLARGLDATAASLRNGTSP